MVFPPTPLVVQPCDHLFRKLCAACCDPGSSIDFPVEFANFRRTVSNIELQKRKEFVSRTHQECAPLFIACQNGHLEMVRFLVDDCEANIEQKGFYQMHGDPTLHHVTPLWCAAVAGELSILHFLISRGADINAVSDSGSTPVRTACFLRNYEVVVCLIQHGADINRANYNGETCLINSIHSVLMCSVLLTYGVEVDSQDVLLKSALHYAVQENRLDTVKLLMSYSANPLLCTKQHDDALTIACLKGHTEIFDHLLTVRRYPLHRLADAFELMGTTFVDQRDATPMALIYWRRAAQLRSQSQLFPKQRAYLNGGCGLEEPSRSLHLAVSAAYGGRTEFETVEDLQNVSVEDMRIQALMVAERILGMYHRKYLLRVMFRGAVFLESQQVEPCTDLWRLGLEARVARDTVLHHEACLAAQALVRLFLDLHEQGSELRCLFLAGRINQPDLPNGAQLRFSDILGTTSVLVDQLGRCTALLKVRPVYHRHLETFDRILKSLVHLFHLLVVNAQTSKHHDDIRVLVQQALEVQPRTAEGDTLLHLVVNRSTKVRSSFFPQPHIALFPSQPVAQLLLEAGAPVTACNNLGCAPLHVASRPENFNSEVVDVLLEHGAHVDQPNAAWELPMQQLAANPHCNINLMHHTRLTCLAARVVGRFRIPYRRVLPVSLQRFVRCHHP